MNAPRQTLPPLSDSPWFWLYTFATFGLVMLVIISPKFEARRVQQERQYQGRARALQQRMGEEPSVPMSTEGHTWLTLRPLYAVLGGLIAIGWVTLWWQRWRARSAARNASE
jgi:hypothetical protein